LNKEIKITVLPPDRFELNQNYPNPFNPTTTTISYIIPAVASSFSQGVHLTIYDILGREVETLVNEEQKPGYYKTEWNASRNSSGMYIYQLTMKNGNKTELLRKKFMNEKSKHSYRKKNYTEQHKEGTEEKYYNKLNELCEKSLW